MEAPMDAWEWLKWAEQAHHSYFLRKSRELDRRAADLERRAKEIGEAI